MAALIQTRSAEYSILQLALPGRPVENLGVLLLDPASGALYIRLRENAAGLAGEEDGEVLSLLEDDLRARAAELGGACLLALFEDSLSNTLRMTGRRSAAVRDFDSAADRIFERHVLGAAPETHEVRPFVTHLPLYSLRAAAGRFGQDMEGEVEDWIEAPPGLRLSGDMYAVHVTGHSMEPAIPDGSLAVFRFKPAGSRNGKRVLVWRRGASAGGGEFTVKVYESAKSVSEEGWEHTGIRLKPLNPDYEVLELDDSGEYMVLGDFVCLMDEEVY
jgi:SOS-response transcriptional repressor LexA